MDLRRATTRPHGTRFEDPACLRTVLGDTRLAWLWLVLRGSLGWFWLEAGWRQLEGPAGTGGVAGFPVAQTLAVVQMLASIALILGAFVGPAAFAGATAERHDAFRRVRGSFAWTLAIVRTARALHLPLQVHTTLCQRTVGDLPAIAHLVDTLGAVVWAVFCLVPTGRATIADELSAAQYEATFAWLARRSATASWSLKLTEGYHYRRFLAQRGQNPFVPSGTGEGRVGRAPGAVNAGTGFCFVSHVGDVCPFKRMCGGSRSRAYVHTGDYLESDPACAYLPLGFTASGSGQP